MRKATIPKSDLPGIIGKRLRTLRINRKLSLDQVGKEIGISGVSVHKIENGVTDIQTQRLEQLATFFEVSLPDLVTGDYFKAEQRTQAAHLSEQIRETEKRLKSLQEEALSLYRMWIKLKKEPNDGEIHKPTT